MSAYHDFVAGKKATTEPAGFEVPVDADYLFPFQRHVVQWALRKGRAAIFAECGLGKTRMQLEWARHIARHTGGRVLIFAPLAVAQQTVREAEACGIEAVYARSGAGIGDASLVITNYERLHLFDVSEFAGVVLDESSILKSFMGKVKRTLVEECSAVKYRLACTATPSPNDHMELGNHAEFLGVMMSNEMLTRWFINDTSCFGTYRLKGHAVSPFWDWVASWAVCIGAPSDLGYSDEGYVLPEETLIPHTVRVDLTEGRGDNLFRIPDMSATSVHKEKRKTASDRAAKVAELVAAEPSEQWIVWCETDYEADALTAAIGDCVEVRGSHPVERKESAALDFVDGKIRVLVSKSSIFGWGLNFQHCARTAFVGATFSWEGFYQARRRTWRFGQKRPVDVHVVMAETESSVWGILMEKRDAHYSMRDQMSAAMRRAMAKDSADQKYAAGVPMMLPQWLKEETQ